MMMDNFIITDIDESGNLTLKLSDYGAWALLRRLKREDACDSVEVEFIQAITNRIEQALTQ